MEGLQLCIHLHAEIMLFAGEMLSGVARGEDRVPYMLHSLTQVR